MRFLSQLQPGEMITVTERWIGSLKPDFLAIPEIAGLLPRVEEDHQAILSARDGSSLEEMVALLTEQASSLDDRHDHLQRALQSVLIAARELLLGLVPVDTARIDQIDIALERLQPKGLEINNATHEAEAGNAAQMVKIADAEFAPVLTQIPMLNALTVLDVVHKIGEVGAALGAAEHEKSLAQVAAKKQTITAAEVKRRMRAWADTVETVLKALERTKAPKETVQKLTQPVLDGIEKARARKLAERNAKKNGPPDGGKAPEPKNG